MRNTFWALICSLAILPASVQAEHSHPAKVVQARFQKVSHDRGRWTGFVSGHGLIQLGLQIIKNGKVFRSHRIGRVTLVHNESPTSFHFNGPLPKGEWTWKIITRTLPYRLAGQSIPKPLL